MKDVIKIKKPNQVSNVKVSHEASSFYADLSKQWAIKLDKPIENGEYSSKYYAKISEQNADSANKSAKSTKETASNLKKFITNSLYFPELKINNEDVISNKLKLQKHSTFDKSKFTVVGSPTITEDGVASGFSKSNYLSTSYVPNQNYKTFSIKFKFNTGSTKTGAYIIGDKMGTANFLLAWSGNTTLALWLSTNNNRDIANGLKGKTILQFNKDYWINFTFDGTKYVLYISADGKTYTPDITITSSLKANIWQLYMGTVWGGSTNYIYDLSLFSITVDGKEVFNGNKTGIDNIKADDYEVAGSPVISDDGVAGGWSKENYITIPDLKLQNAKTWKIEGVVDIKSAQTEGVPCWLSTAQENGLMLPIWSDGTYAKFQLYLSSSASAWDIVNTESPNVLLSEGSTFKCELEFTGTQYVYTIYQVATGRKVAVLTADSSDKVYQSPTVLGIKRNTHPMASDNRINLNAFKIYVDGNLVYQPCLKIPYTQSKTGSKIVDGGYRDRVQDMYEQYGYTHYYTLGDEDYTLATCKGTDVVESSDNYEQTADLTLRQWGSATSGQTVNLLPYKDTNYAVTLANGSKTKSSFVANATGDYFAVGKTVLG